MTFGFRVKGQNISFFEKMWFFLHTGLAILKCIIFWNYVDFNLPLYVLSWQEGGE